MTKLWKSVALCVAGLAFQFPAKGAPAERSVSVSRQFVIYGPDVRLRGVVGDLAEQTKRELLGAVRARDDWRLPIVINAQLAQANLPERAPAGVTFSQTDAGLKLQIDLALGTEIDVAQVQREILRALLIEMTYRDVARVATGTAYLQPPEWLLEGFAARFSGVPPPRILEPLKPLAAAHKLASLREILLQRPELLDASARSLYRAYCFQLTELLTSAPECGPKLVAVIRSLADTPADPVAALEKHFRAFATSERGAEGAWTKAVTDALTADRIGLLSIAETEAALEDALSISIGKSGGVAKKFPLASFPEFIREPAAPAALQLTSRALLLLATRANPVCRPIVAGYQEITAQLSRRKTKGVAARLADLQALRAQLAARGREIDDYLNWFEATQATAASGMFTEYLKAAERAAAVPRTRTDAMSRYLSQLESQMDQ